MDKCLTDSPIETLDEDSLNIKNFTDALTDTIIDVDTPYSISLYGEWGSGKTSILNIVKRNLENRKYNIVWINAWTTFTLAGQKELRNLFIAQILSSLFSLADNLIKLFKPFFVDSIVSYASKKLNVDAGCTRSMLKQLAEVPLQERFKVVISKANELKGTDKTIIFVDDLDRLKPAEVLVILDAISIFFKVKGCVFFLAMDHHRINCAIEKLNSSLSGEKYHSHYLDKVVQLNVIVPIWHYDIKNLLINILDIPKKAKDDDRAMNYYILLAVYSVGSVPRNIKKICSKFNFYKKILLSNIERSPTDTEKDFYPLGNSFLFQSLFAMLCFQESYSDVYEMLISTHCNYKEIIVEIENLLRENKCSHAEINIDKKYYENIQLKENLLSFIDIFIRAIDVNESEKKSFSAGGRFLITIISRILQCSLNKSIDIYHEKLPFTIKSTAIIEKFFSHHLGKILKDTNAQFRCSASDYHIDIALIYPCGQASFSFVIVYQNKTVRSHIESQVQNSQSWRNKIFNWVERCCIGLPDRKYIQHSQRFVQFNVIFYDEYTKETFNPFHFFIRVSIQFMMIFSKAIKKLHDINVDAIETLLFHRKCLLERIYALFSDADWHIKGDLDINYRWNGVMICKKTWNDKLYITLDQDRQFLQNILIGIKKSIWNGKFIDDEEIKFREYVNKKYGASFEYSSYYVIYHYTTPRSLSASDYFSGLKLLYGPGDDPISPIIEELKKFKALENEIENLAHKARY